MLNSIAIYGAQMGRFFTHFALRSLFVLYMIKGLAASDFQAFSVSAFVCSMVELAAVLGGVIADRYLGVRKATLWGSVLLLLGYSSLIFPPLFYGGLALIVVGSSLFVSNISAMLSLHCIGEEGESQSRFTKMYSLQNLSALAGTILASSVAAIYGFSYGLSAAAIGIGISCLLLYRARLSLPNKDPLFPSLSKPIFLLASLYVVCTVGCLYASLFLPFLPIITVGALIGLLYYLKREQLMMGNMLYPLLIRLCALVFFFVIEDQVSSSLMLLTERSVDRTIGHWMIPSAFIMGLNPIVIVLCGTLFARRTIPLMMPFIVTALGFGGLALVCSQMTILPLPYIMGAVSLISMAELMIGPSTLSCVSQAASLKTKGVMMGLTSLAFSLAYQLSGLLGRFYFSQGDGMTASYVHGFLGISMALFAVGGALYLLQKRKFLFFTKTESL